jgi:hypothetical protein
MRSLVLSERYKHCIITMHDNNTTHSCKHSWFSEPMTYPSKAHKCSRPAVKDGFCEYHWKCSYQEYKKLEDRIDEIEKYIDSLTESL